MIIEPTYATYTENDIKISTIYKIDVFEDDAHDNILLYSLYYFDENMNNLIVPKLIETKKGDNNV